MVQVHAQYVHDEEDDKDDDNDEDEDDQDDLAKPGMVLNMPATTWKKKYQSFLTMVKR